MAYEYDNDNGLRQPQPPKKDSDIGSWIFIAVMFTVAWPIGLILLLIKLSESGNKRKNARRTAGQSGQRTSQRVTEASPQAEKARSAVEQVTRTPDYTDKGAKTMKIIGAILGVVGCISLLAAVEDNLSFAIHYNEWMYFLRQMFYPLGLLTGGVSLLLGSGAMKRRQRRFATYLRTAGKKPAVPLDYLARATDVSRRRVEKDVDLMLEKGLWGDKAYVDMGSGMLFRSQAAATAYFDKTRQPQQTPEPAVPPQASEGYAGTLRQIRELNDRIADEALSAKIDRIEQVSGRIFKAIEDTPAKKNAAGTFLNYYLPTTLKLLENYAAFEEAGARSRPWRWRTACAAWCRASCRRRAATPTRATGTGFWSIPSIPGRRSGTAARCRRCCSADTTATWRIGARGRATSAPWRGVPTCGRNSI